MLQIEKDDIIGYSWHPTEDCTLQISYMPKIKRMASVKYVREARYTPWLCQSQCSDSDSDADQRCSGDGHSALGALTAHVDAMFGGHGKRRRALIIINPKSGRGDAAESVESTLLPLLRNAGSMVVTQKMTEYPKHATEIMLEAQPGEYDVVLSAGGDGTVHEILQGMLQRADWQEMAQSLQLVQVPCGSGNALAASCGIWDIATAAYAAIRGEPTSMDIASIHQPSTNSTMYSFLSVTYGMVANLDIGTEHLRWMGGARFIWGAIKEIISQRMYDIEISYIGMHEEEEEDADYGTTRCNRPPCRWIPGHTGQHPKVNDNDSPWKTIHGTQVQLCVFSNLPWLDMNFNLAPHAEMGGGCYNLLYTVGRQGLSRSMQLLNKAETGEHMHLIDEVRVFAFYIHPKSTNTWLVIDGEPIPNEPIYGEIHKQLCQVLLP